MHNWKAILFKSYEVGSVLFLIVVALFSVLALNSKYNQNAPYHLFSVVSGSMAPEYPVGTGVLVLHQSSYLINDVVTYVRGNQKVTHRIVFAGSYYLTKGDANKEIDQQTIGDQDIIGKVIFSFPFIGSLQQSTKSLGGLFGFVILPSILIIIHESYIVIKEFKKIQFVHASKVAAIGTGIFFLFLSVTLTSQVQAYFTGSASGLPLVVTTGNFTISPSPTISPSATPSPFPTVSPSPTGQCINSGNGVGSVNVCGSSHSNTTEINQTNNSTTNTTVTVNSNTGGNSTSVGSGGTVLVIETNNSMNSNGVAN